jgi:uncharacterized protein (TIGR00299 family) protein
MRIAYLDCFSGVSGDMFLGALVAAGVPIALLRETVAALKVGAELEVSSVMRSGIKAVKIDVVVQGEKDLPREVYQAQKGTHHVNHSFVHEHDHEHRHEHWHSTADISPPGLPETPRPHKHEHGRSLRQIREIIAQAPISAASKTTAIAIFQALGEAEAGIHQVSLEDLHFHEVGSTDAIVDITCAAVGADALGVDQWFCSPLNVGGGTVECAHGRFPVPAPATLELLRRRNAPVYSSGIDKELTTPTGAAIVSVLARGFGSFPSLKIDRVGYGAGYRDLPGHANVLRLTVGEADSAELAAGAAAISDANTDVVSVLETNLDDVSPQVIGYVIERALAEGALDVFTSPVQMKKNRPGLLLTVLCRPEDKDRLSGLLFAETTTLGVRVRQELRQCLTRRHVPVQTPWGEVRLKLGNLNGDITNCAPEFEDCRRIAAEHKIPLKTVMQEAVRLYLERHHE